MVQLARELVKDITFTYALNVFCCNIVVFMIVHTICILLLKLYFLSNSLVSIYKSIDFVVYLSYLSIYYQSASRCYRARRRFVFGDVNETSRQDLYLGMPMRHQCINNNAQSPNKIENGNDECVKETKTGQRADKVKGQKVVIILHDF